MCLDIPDRLIECRIEQLKYRKESVRRRYSMPSPPIPTFVLSLQCTFLVALQPFPPVCLYRPSYRYSAHIQFRPSYRSNPSLSYHSSVPFLCRISYRSSVLRLVLLIALVSRSCTVLPVAPQRLSLYAIHCGDKNTFWLLHKYHY